MRLTPALLLLLSCATATAPATAPEPIPAPKATAPELRIPAGAHPTGYKLSLKVVPGEDVVSGEVRVSLVVDQSVDVLWLNGQDLTPTSAQLIIGGQAVPARADVANAHFIAVSTGHPIAPGPVELVLGYTGPLSRKNNFGFFQLHEEGRDYAYTHFEPIDARRAFPCFDEPQFKVPWQVTLHVKKEHVAFSNTKVVSEQDEPNGMKAVQFAQTEPLPSYLVAMAVGPFDVTDGGSWGRNKTPVRIITPKGQGTQAKWAAESTGPILEQLEAYFGIPYPFDKLDEISLPLGIGAMENPGLVTYGNLIILAKPEEDTPGRQRQYAGTCSHELAHMWFGDLVTMAWWDDLWLNEAFATWMSAKIIETWKPKWDADVNRVFRRSGALASDGMINARRIRQPIATNDDIRNAFDGITYSKGATVLTMFESYVGEEKFREGVRAYLTEHASKNATAADFLAAESKAFGQDLAPAFNTFLDQAGAPQVAFELTCDKGKGAKLSLSQQRYLPLGSKGDRALQWKIPVCVRTDLGRSCTLLEGEKGTIDFKSCPRWVLPNDGMRGYYRSNVFAAGWSDVLDSQPGRPHLAKPVLGKWRWDGERLLRAAGDKLSIAERVGALGDLLSMVNAGQADLRDALETVPVALLANNRHLTGAALGIASTLGDDTVPDPEHGKYQQWVRETFGPVAKKLALQVAPADDEDTRLLRPGVVGFVAREGVEPALRTQSLALATQWLKDHKAVHPDLVDTVLAIGADTGDAALHEALLDGAKKTPERIDRLRMLQALGTYRTPDVVSAQLPLVLGNDFDTRDAMRLVWGAAGSARTRDLAIDFVTRNFDALVQRLPADWGADLVGITGGTCDEKHRDAAKTFFDGRSTKYMGGPRNFALTLEGIDLCIAWRAKHRADAIAFFDAWKPSAK
jgi:alanyl aminopeptidase